MPQRLLVEQIAVALLELVHAAAAVYQLLLAGEERVAIGADADALFFSRGVDFPDFSASADDFCGAVVRMDSFFHFRKPCSYGLSVMQFCFQTTAQCAVVKTRI